MNELLRRLLVRFSPYWSGVMVFDQADDNAGDGKGGAGGGDKDGEGAGGDKGDQKGDAVASKDQAYELIIDGEKRSVTVDEMKDLAQKAGGADKKYQDAAKLRKSAEEALRQQDLIKKIGDSGYSPSEAEIRELASTIGVDPEEFVQYLSESDDPAEGKKKPAAGAEMDEAAFERVFEQQFGMKPDAVKAVVDMSHQRHIDDARKEIRRISDEAVDKDEIFGKMIVGEDKDAREEAVKEMVAEDVLRRIQDGTPFGAELVAASVQKIRAHLNKIGIPGKPAMYPVTLGQGPSGGLPAEVQSETPIKRVNAAEDGDESNFIARAMQKGLQMMRNAPRR